LIGKDWAHVAQGRMVSDCTAGPNSVAQG